MSNDKDIGDVEFDRAQLLKRVGVFCVLSALALVICDIVFAHNKLIDVGAVRRYFNITREDGIANWFSSTQMLFVGITNWLIFFRTSGPTKKGWALLASAFTFIAIDDATKLHERIGTATRVLTGGSYKDPDSIFAIFPSYSWQLVLGPFFAVLGLYIVWFVWENMGNKKLFFMVCGGLGCFALAVSFDFIEGFRDNPYDALADSLGTRSKTISHFSKLIEEWIEMSGNTLLLLAFLSKLTSLPGDFVVRFKTRA